MGFFYPHTIIKRNNFPESVRFGVGVNLNNFNNFCNITKQQVSPNLWRRRIAGSRALRSLGEVGPNCSLHVYPNLIFAGSSNGRTQLSGSCYLGSNPGPAANTKNYPSGVVFSICPRLGSNEKGVGGTGVPPCRNP